MKLDELGEKRKEVKNQLLTLVTDSAYGLGYSVLECKAKAAWVYWAQMTPKEKATYDEPVEGFYRVGVEVVGVDLT